MIDFAALPTCDIQAALSDPRVGESWKRQAVEELRKRGAVKKGKAHRANHLATELYFAHYPGSTIFELRPEPPSANAIKRWLYHPRAKHRYAQYVEHLTGLFARFRGLVRYDEPMVVEHSWRLVRERDEDSFALGLKPVLDAMQQAGLLSDDKLVRLRFAGQRGGGEGARQERHLLLRIEPLSK